MTSYPQYPDASGIDAKFIKDNVATTVWLRDDYLMMNGVQGPGVLYDFLDAVWNTKQAARKAGWEFEA